MEEKRYILIRANKYGIEAPEFFDSYYDAHEEMRRQYESFSKGCVGELNDDDDAWCMYDDGSVTNWKIFDLDNIRFLT